MNISGTVKAAAMWVWQAPQNALGLALTGLALLGGGRTLISDGAARVTMAMWRGSVSLGRYIVLSRRAVLGESRERALLHEMGHQVQSLMLGPLYLPAVGLPSLAWAALRRAGLFRGFGYYDFYTERWANDIAGLE